MNDIMTIFDSSCSYWEPGMSISFDDETLSNPRCISIESDASSDLPGRGAATAGYSDISKHYDVCPTILGTGGYGCVRECQHRTTGVKYAVKTINKPKGATLYCTHLEIELLRSIGHPRIIKMVDCYEDSNFIHIVTEKCNGGELFDQVVSNTTDHGCLPEDQAASIIKSLLEAVEYIHSQNVVHRDIKPENVLFEDEAASSVKLIDFGMSCRHGLNDADMTNQVGAPYYMSPAVIQGKYNRSCDVWAVGIVSYVLLCGYPPFNGSSDIDIQTSILRGNIVFEDDVWAHLSDSSRDFVTKLFNLESGKTLTAAEALRHPWIAGA